MKIVEGGAKTRSEKGEIILLSCKYWHGHTVALLLIISLAEGAGSAPLPPPCGRPCCSRYPTFYDIKFESVFSTPYVAYLSEKEQLLKFDQVLSMRALNTSSMELQNVKQSLKQFSPFSADAWWTLGAELGLPYAGTTSAFIGIIVRWLSVVIVKSLKQGQRSNDEMQKTVSQFPDSSLNFSISFLFGWILGVTRNGTLALWQRIRMLCFA